MKYFSNCKTIEQIKTVYKQLAKQNHPDIGGETVTMQRINVEYVYACARLAKGLGLTDEQFDTEIIQSERYREAIEKIIHLPGIIIEIVGNWIWVTGNSKPVKDELKDAHFFAHKKCAWYFRADEFKTRGGKKSLDEIRAKYGSERIKKTSMMPLSN